MISYNPLAGGVLTGRYRQATTVEPGTRFSLKHSGEVYRRRYWNDAVFEEVKRLADFLEQRGKNLTQVALAWVLVQSGITSAILGASKPGQLEESLRGVDIGLDEEERGACDEVWFNLPRERDAQIARR